MTGWNQQQNPWSYNSPKKDPQKNMETYSASILQGGQDYDDIMARYRGIANRGPDPNQNSLQNYYNKLLSGPQSTAGTPFVSKDLKYQRGPELSAAFKNLSEYSKTGGISDAEGRDIRARGVSPIRSVYANAQQNLNRSRALGGGYSPNYAASSAKMAREMSGQLADATTNVEAGLAEQRQQGRLAMAPQYAAFADRETATMGNINSQNEDNRFRAQSFNEDSRLRAEEISRNTQNQGISGLMGLYGMNRDREMQALQGMSGMYGQAPGMAQLYGNQALERKRLDQNEGPQSSPYTRGGRSLGGYRPPSQYSGSQWR